MGILLEHISEGIFGCAELFSEHSFFGDFQDIVLTEVFVIEGNTAVRADIYLTVDVDIEKTAAHITDVALYDSHISLLRLANTTIYIISKKQEIFTIFAFGEI